MNTFYRAIEELQDFSAWFPKLAKELEQETQLQHIDEEPANILPCVVEPATTLWFNTGFDNSDIATIIFSLFTMFQDNASRELHIRFLNEYCNLLNNHGNPEVSYSLTNSEYSMKPLREVRNRIENRQRAEDIPQIRNDENCPP